MARKRPTPQTKAEFLALEAAVWRELSSTWRGLPEAALQQPGAAGPEWSLKDVMNHLAAWMDATRDVLPRLLAREKLPKGEYHIEEFNARHSAADRGRSAASSRRRLNRSRRALLAVIATLPEATVVDAQQRPGRWIKYATYGHYDEHLAALNAFRALVLTTDH